MTEDTIITEDEGRVRVVRLNRPEKANSLTPGMLESLARALEGAQEDDKVRVVVITGTGDNFTTGMDINALKEYPVEENPRISARMERLGAETSRLLLEGKPSVCAVNGRAMGMGVVYTLACDLRYAVDSATFRLPEIDASIIPAANCMTLLVKQVGLAVAKEIIFTGRSYSANEYLDMGLVSRLLPKEGFIGEAIRAAKELSRKNQDVLRFTKFCLNRVAFLTTFDDASKLEEGAFLSTFQKDKDAWMSALKGSRPR
ncbi:MAG: enoyl-CoA hydratase/isomerase family protein [Candidatus Lokiarchaeota archaeon]|nr:enoyl-CoA hydratase/isomerase family protein [Candidatus Lokiarchaeota archaeon]